MFLALSFILGLLIGSFLNCLVWRLHKDETILGRSYCPHCRHQLAWYDNMPVLSYVLLGGKCRYCHKRISIQYPLVELATGLLFALAAASVLSGPAGSDLAAALFWVMLGRAWLVVGVMVVIFIFDLRWYLIPDQVTLPAMAAVVAFNLAIEFWLGGGEAAGLFWRNWLIGGIIGGGFFLLQFLATKGKGIGGGDLRLGLLMGLVLGWQNLLVALFLAYMAGSIVGLTLISLGKKQWGSKLPLGVFLAPASLVAMLWGSYLWRWYANFLY